MTDSTITAGYYSFGNELYVYNYNSSDFNSYKEVVSHEFIHMLQVDEEYRYLCESSAELMACEYFDCEVNSYVEEVKRLRVLMEIIGSESIKKYNFTGGIENVFMEVKSYLDEDNYKSFVEIMRYDPACYTYEENYVVNKQLDSILAILYENKFGRDISTDRVIDAIYNGNFIYNYMEKPGSGYDVVKHGSYQRYYFNSDYAGCEDNYLYCYDMVTMDLKEAYDEDKILIRDKVYWDEYDYDFYMMNKDDCFVSIDGRNKEMDEYWTSYIDEAGRVVFVGEMNKIGFPSIWEKFPEDNYSYEDFSLEHINQECYSRQMNNFNGSSSKVLKLVKTKVNN